MSLREQLAAIRAKSAERIPEPARAIMHRATEDLRKSGITERVPKVGARAPDFSLPNQNGQIVSLGGMLKNGPVVISFYRGKW